MRAFNIVLLSSFAVALGIGMTAGFFWMIYLSGWLTNWALQLFLTFVGLFLVAENLCFSFAQIERYAYATKNSNRD